jgi:hypothetical protein
MNARKLLPAIVTAIAAQVALFSTAARAEAADCFPLCEQAAEQVSAQNTDGTKEGVPLLQCDNKLVKQAESVNARIKPVKEIVGYVRSPQGLAIKLVNDHVVKIPAWVGYAADPVGSLKNRAMNEVKSRVREAVMPASTCADAGTEDSNSETGAGAVDNWDLLSV